MRSKLMISVGVVVLLLTVARAGTDNPGGQKEKKDEATLLQITVRQLPAENGVVPVELRCGTAVLSAPNTLDSAPCVLLNDTGKYIRAATVAISIITEKDGRLSAGVDFQTFDTFLHPDFRAEHGSNLIPPGGQTRVQSVQTSYDEAVIRGVKMWLDYVEFADAAALGPDKAGSRTVAGLRAGAAKYKEWLVREYERAGRSVSETVSLLERETIPPDVGIKSADEEQGAVFYRNHMLRTYKAQGAQSLLKYFAPAGQRASKGER